MIRLFNFFFVKGLGKLLSKMSLSSKREDVRDDTPSHNEMVNLSYRLDDREFNPIVKEWGKNIWKFYYFIIFFVNIKVGWIKIGMGMGKSSNLLLDLKALDQF